MSEPRKGLTDYYFVRRVRGLGTTHIVRPISTVTAFCGRFRRPDEMLLTTRGDEHDVCGTCKRLEPA